MINSKKLLNVFCDLVKIDSVSGEEDLIADYLVKTLRKSSDLVRKDSYGNVYARFPGVGQPVFFSAHMDTVEPGRNIQPKVQAGYIVSDGTTILGGDNKSAIAAILSVLPYLPSLNNHRPFELIFTRSEETGNYGAINFDYSLLESKQGYCFDFESPVGTIVTASPFYERFDIELIGRAAHASRPQDGINSLVLLGKILAQLKIGRLDEESLLNIGVVKGGSVRNTVPGQINLAGEIRSFSETKLVRHKNDFIQLLRTLAKNSHSKLKIDFVRENGGYKLAKSDQFIEITAQFMKKAGLKSKLTEGWGVSDANIFHDHGLLCLNLGDGGQNAHTTREKVAIRQLERLANLIEQLARG